MNCIQNLVLWCHEKKERHQQKKALASQKKLECMSSECINVMEFNGKLYVSHNGVPIVPVSCLNVDVEKLLVDVRKSYLAWRNKFKSVRYGEI